jgi:ribosome assembly protein RRB1
VAGQQTARGKEKESEIMVMKMSSLARNPKDDESDDESDDDESDDPILETKSITVGSCVNRLRAFQAPQATASKLANTLVASMHENGEARIYDGTRMWCLRIRRQL